MQLKTLTLNGTTYDSFAVSESDKQEIAEKVADLVEIPTGGGSVTSYNSPTEVPLESGSQYILYGSTGGTISVQVGSNENNKVEYQFSTGFDIVWFLYVKTSDSQGSIIETSGTRKVINFEGDSSKMKISSTIPFWIVIKVSQDGSGGNASKYPDWSHLKWYVIGDSLTDRSSPYTEKYYYDFIYEKTGIQVIVDGVSATGYKTGEDEGKSFLDRVKKAFPKEDPTINADIDIVSIFGSGNDMTATDLKYADSAIYDTMAWFALYRPGLRVIVVPPSPWKSPENGTNYNKRGEMWKAYCDRLQTCALACECRYVSDMYDCPPFNPNFNDPVVPGHMARFFTTDPSGIHPNEEGHKALAPYFYNALLQELAFKV